MNKPFKKIVLAALFLILSFGFVALAEAQADDYGLTKAATGAKLQTSVAGATNVPQLIGKIVGAGLSLLGIIFFILILYAGIRWMTAMGKTEDVEKAKSTIEAAVIGLVIVLAAYAVTNFVFTELAGTGESGTGGTAGGGGGGCIYALLPPAVDDGQCNGLGQPDCTTNNNCQWVPVD